MEISALDSRRCADGSLLSGKDFWNRNDDDIPLTELEQVELDKICQQVMNFAFISDGDVLRVQEVKDRFPRVAVRTLERALAEMEGDGRLVLASKRSRCKEWRIDKEKMQAMGVSVLLGPGEDADELADYEALYGGDDDHDDDGDGDGGEAGERGDINEDSICAPTPTISTHMSAKKEKIAKRKEGAGAREKSKAKAKVKQNTKRKREDSPERADPTVVLNMPFLGGFSPPALETHPVAPIEYPDGLTGKRVEDISLAVFACVGQDTSAPLFMTTLIENLVPSACTAEQLNFVIEDLERRNKLMLDDGLVFIII